MVELLHRGFLLHDHYRIKKRLISLDHYINIHSIERIVYQELSPNPRLTRRGMLYISTMCCTLSIHNVTIVWRQILPRLEAESNARKRRGILANRAGVIPDVYNEYKRMASPRSWPTLPNANQILLLEPFLSLYNSVSDAPLDRAACISQLPATISRWSDELRHKLASLVPIQPIELGDRPLILSNLELATSVSVCRGCLRLGKEGCLIGWDNVKNHLSCPRLLQARCCIRYNAVARSRSENCDRKRARWT